MDYKKMFDIQQIMLLIGFILIGAIGRYVLFGLGVQPFPNFEIIMVLTFLAAMFLRPTIAFLVPLFSMIFSDILIGNPIFVGSQMNKIVLFTYSGFAIIALVNILKRDQLRNALGKLRLKNIGIAGGLGVGFVLIYDVWTNMGWWYLMYPHNTTTLAAVFTAGIPFMIYHMISGVVTFIAIALPIMVIATNKDIIRLPTTPIKTMHKIPVALLVILLIGLSFSGTAMKVPQKSEVWLEHSETTSVTVVIDGDGWTISDNVFAYADDTAFTILQRCSKRNDFVLEYTFWEEFDSILIDSINNVENGKDGMYWQYYVNEDIPMIGSDNYKLENGDYVRWSFEEVPW